MAAGCLEVNSKKFAHQARRSEELKHFAVKIIRARAGAKVDDGAGAFIRIRR